jgi:mannosyltransferase OCH1-like enzyme
MTDEFIELVTGDLCLLTNVAMIDAYSHLVTFNNGHNEFANRRHWDDFQHPQFVRTRYSFINTKKIQRISKSNEEYHIDLLNGFLRVIIAEEDFAKLGFESVKETLSKSPEFNAKTRILKVQLKIPRTEVYRAFGIKEKIDPRVNNMLNSHTWQLRMKSSYLVDEVKYEGADENDFKWEYCYHIPAIIAHQNEYFRMDFSTEFHTFVVDIDRDSIPSKKFTDGVLNVRFFCA